MTAHDVRAAMDEMAAVLTQENTALEAARFDEIASILPRKRAAADALQAATACKVPVNPEAASSLRAGARLLEAIMKTNAALIAEALAIQRQVIELLVRPDTSALGSNLYGRYGRYCDAGRNTGQSAQWTATTA